MRVRHRKKPLPRNWAVKSKSYGILGEIDIKVRHTSRLWLKALMFRTNDGLRRFWAEILQRERLDRSTLGVVNALGCEVVTFPKGGGQRSVLEVDPRYFAVMGLITGRCHMEVLTHEAVHAAFAYAKRVHHRDLWHNAKSLDEENVCYPAGRSAAELAAWCLRRGYHTRRRP